MKRAVFSPSEPQNPSAADYRLIGNELRELSRRTAELPTFRGQDAREGFGDLATS